VHEMAFDVVLFYMRNVRRIQERSAAS